ncbi:transposase, partial [Tannerella forsythia]|uniref:transposase n=1 Tax=Tannerella forsythia TaxID=28112 RepID=UPI00163B1EF3
ERFAFRRQAIRLKKSGRSQKEIAQIIGIRPATICQWCKDYEHEGQKGLIAKKRGVKSEDKKLLSDSQELLIQKMITDTILRKWGFTPQKPKKQAYEQCPKAVQKWLNEDYPSIKERAKKENAEIYWGDETGVKNQCNHGRSYAPKGKTPIKKSTSKHFSVNMFSAVTNQGKVQFMIYSEAMNAERLIEFLKQLIQSSR